MGATNLSGVIDSEVDAAGEVLTEIEWEIVDTPPTSHEGAAAKLRIAELEVREALGGGDDIISAVVLSAIAYARRLLG